MFGLACSCLFFFNDKNHLIVFLFGEKIENHLIEDQIRPLLLLLLHLDMNNKKKCEKVNLNTRREGRHGKPRDQASTGQFQAP